MTLPFLMRLFAPAYCLFTLASGLPTVAVGANADAPATPLAADRAAIQADYKLINAAFTKHDLTEVMSYYASDYTETDSDNNTLDRKQQQKRYKAEMSQMQTMQSRYTILGCSEVPAGVEMEIRVHTEGTGQKHILFATIHGTFTNELWTRDLWVSTPEGWRLKHRHTFEDSTHTHLG